MGRSEDYKKMESSADGGTVKNSYMNTSQSSNDSYSSSESSRKSKETPGTSPSLVDSSSLRPLRSLLDYTTQPHAVKKTKDCCDVCKNWDDLNHEQQVKQVIKISCRTPWKIAKWETPKTVRLQRDDNRSIGFKYKNIQDMESGVKYTIIFEVFRDGPAYDCVRQGDLILSANGQNLHGSQGLSLQSIVMENKTEPVKLVIQRPQEIKCNRRTRRMRLKRSVSQENLASVSEGCLERMDSGDSSRASKTSSDESDALPRSIKDRLDCLADCNGERLETHMPRLPCLKIFVAGSKANELATSLFRGAGVAKSLPCDIGMCYQASVTKTSSGYNLSPSRTDPKMQITDLLESLLEDDNAKTCALTDHVELEITAFKSHPLSTYAQHVLYTAHSVFVLQFSHQDFLSDMQSVFLDIQKKLNKIRTYASNSVPVYLVITADDSLPLDELKTIGNSLHQHFNKAFPNQLQYNSSINLPLFQATRNSPNMRANSLANHFANLSCCDESYFSNDAEQCHILPSIQTNSYNVCYLARNNSKTTSGVDTDTGFNVAELRDHISQTVFKQRFVPDRYPFSYLLHRERVSRLKSVGLCYAYKATIKAECKGIASEREFSSLLRFLHNSGDIICADFLGHVSDNTLSSKQPTNDILLDPCHLLTATKQLTTLPELSEQQDPNFPDAMKHWKNLQESFVASLRFLEYILKKDAERFLLLTSLSLMSIIYPFHEPSSPPTAQCYLVPFFLHVPPKTNSHPQVPYSPHDPRLYNLCLDFHGSIPDGYFLSWLIGLLRRAWQTHGQWSIKSTQFAELSLANDCEMEIVCDEINSVVKVAARCSVTYQLQDLLHVIVDNLKSGVPITIGPPCPLAAHQCATQLGEPGKTHVIDIARGLAPVPLWCGKQRVDQYLQVNHWLIKPADTVQVSPSNCPTNIVSLQTHIKDLPPKLFNWLCNKLNPSPDGRGWQAIAGNLWYTNSQVEVLNIQRESRYDPCRSFLHDWGRRANATLGALIDMLGHKNGGIGRQDIVVDLQREGFILPLGE